MELLSLPIEVVRKIIYHLVEVCGLYDAVLLRPVSKMFNEEILFTICNTSLIDLNAYGWAFLMNEDLASQILLARARRTGPTTNFLVGAMRRIIADYAELEITLGRVPEADRLPQLCAAIADVNSHQFAALQMQRGNTKVKYTEDKQLAQLSFAAYLGDEEAVLHLVDNGAILDGICLLLGQPLRAAAGNGQTRVCSLLLNHMGYEDSEAMDVDADASDEIYSALAAAAVGGHDQVLGLLLKPQYRIDPKAPQYMDALIKAADKGRTGVVRLLLDHAKFLKPYDVHVKLMKSASRNNHLELLDYLIASNRDFTQKALTETDSVLLLPASQGHYQALQKLLDVLPEDEKFPFHHDTFVSAVKKGGVQVVKLLMEMGANLNQPSRYGKPLRSGTPTDVAIRYGHLQIIKIFVEKGADLSKINLVTAVQRHDETMIRYLVSVGVDVNAVDEKGDSPMLVAKMESRNSRMIELLKSLGATDIDPLTTKYAKGFEKGEYPKPAPLRGLKYLGVGA